VHSILCRTDTSLTSEPNCSCLWSLFDAVQRLPRRPDTSFRFTFLDRLRTPRRNHLLRFRETTTIDGLRLHGFEQLGEGAIPSLFWTADNGRLLLFSSGITGFVLDTNGNVQ
jgi:hypothetical protein